MCCRPVVRAHETSKIIQIMMLCGNQLFRNKLQKRVTALNRDLPPRDEQFISDYEQLRMQFPVSIRITLPVLLGMRKYIKQ